MDFRDFSAWAAEARRRALERRSEMYSAALLPNQAGDSIRRVVDGVTMQLYEIDHEDELADIEAMAKKKLVAWRARRAARAAEQRQGGEMTDKRGAK